MIHSYAELYKKGLLSDNIVFQTTMDGRRQIVRYVPELDKEGVQELPPENLCRLAFKMATGSGNPIDLEAEALRPHLARLELQEGIAKYLA